MALFIAKPLQGKKEKKKSFRVPFLPNLGGSITKNVFKQIVKKNSKNHHSSFMSSQTRRGQAVKEKKKEFHS